MKLTIDTDWFLCLQGEPTELMGEVFTAILWGNRDLSPAARVGFNAVKRFMDRAAELKAKRSVAGKAGYAASSLVETPVVKEDGTVVQVNPEEQLKKDIEYIYGLYPSKCLTKGRSLGKCYKDKEKIKILLRSKSVDQVAATINNYITDCVNNNSYMKNFGTFLNNFPEDDIASVASNVKEEEDTVWQ